VTKILGAPDIDNARKVAVADVAVLGSKCVGHRAELRLTQIDWKMTDDGSPYRKIMIIWEI
jgi:hypothetical protein